MKHLRLHGRAVARPYKYAVTFYNPYMIFSAFALDDL
jgi:hypothetical protein